MKIIDLKKLDVGISNVEIEGKVNYVKFAKNFKGEKDGKKYDFWSQFIVLEDDTDSIGCSINFGKEEDKLEKFNQVKIKGKIEEYKDKNDNIQKKLSGYIVKNEKEKKEEKEKNIEKEKSNDIWEKKDLRIARECAIKASVELIIAKIIETKDLFSSSKRIVNYIYNGYIEKQKKANKVKKEKITGKGKTDLLIEEINSLRNENFLNDDKDFYKALSLNKKLEEYTEKELKEILGKLKGCVPEFEGSDEDVPF